MSDIFIDAIKEPDMKSISIARLKLLGESRNNGRKGPDMKSISIARLKLYPDVLGEVFSIADLI